MLVLRNCLCIIDRTTKHAVCISAMLLITNPATCATDHYRNAFGNKIRRHYKKQTNYKEM